MVGDIITAVDGRAIKDGDDLVSEITSRRPGSAIRLGYLRDGKQPTPRSPSATSKGLRRSGRPTGRTWPRQQGRCR